MKCFTYLTVIILFTGCGEQYSYNSTETPLAPIVSDTMPHQDIMVTKAKKSKKRKAGTNYTTSENYSNKSYSEPRKTKQRKTYPVYSSRCQAITKKGYQRSRRARSGGYCWQHGG